MKSKASLLVLAFTASLTLGAHAQKVKVYVSPNDIQTAEQSGIMGVTQNQIFTEDFSEFTLTPYSYSTYDEEGNEYVHSGFQNQPINGYHSDKIGVSYSGDGGNVQPHDIYGGLDSGNYLGVASSHSTTLTLDAPAQYFGFYFTAGDPFNLVDIYSGGNLLLSFSTATLINMLPHDGTSQITAINGSKYNTSDYYGQPGGGGNGSEPYAYLHFVTSGATTFDKIVLTQGQSAIFENDNHSILTVAPILPGTLVEVPPPVGSAVPEGGPGALALSLLAGSLGFIRKKRSI